MEVSGKRAPGYDGHKSCVFCDPCKGEKENEPAVSYCTECNEYLCHGCRKAHARAKATKGHPLLDQDSMPKHKPTSDKDSMCPKHRDKALEYHCKKHDEFCCSICATIDHKQCIIQHIDEIANDFHQSKEYVALRKATTDLIRLLQETKGAATRNINELATLHANFISELQHFRIELNNKLDLLEKATMREVQTARDTDTKSLKSVAKRCDSMLYDIHSLSSKLDELNKYKQERQLVICSKKAAGIVKRFGNSVNVLSKQINFKDYKFQPNEKLRHVLDLLISLSHTRERKDVGEPNSHHTSHQYTASYVGDIDVRHSTDKEPCRITGGVLINETKLALVDHENSSVKVVDVTRNTLRSCMKLLPRPWNITCGNLDQIVVTCSKGKLVILKVGKSLSVLKELDIGRDCRGVVYSNDTFIVSFGHPEPSVKILDMKGKVLKIFKTNKAGGALFSNPEHISLSSDQQTIFVSDESRNTVTSLTLDGKVQHVYTADSLKGPRGLAVDRIDNVYIAGFMPHTIHQISTDGNQSQVILEGTRVVEYPWMMAYCKTRHRLYIGIKKYGYNDVSVFQLNT